LVEGVGFESNLLWAMAQALCLWIERVRHRRVGTAHAADQRVVDEAVEMNEAADAELLLIGEAACGVAGNGVLRDVGAVRKAGLALGVIRPLLQHVAVLEARALGIERIESPESCFGRSAD
jgi:hypothetical protein